jgi:hypothetical protein
MSIADFDNHYLKIPLNASKMIYFMNSQLFT